MPKYKTIEHERFEDAPFVGALISAINCHNDCKDCFNQNLKNMVDIENSAKNIIAEIKNNPFNKGVIFAGLEWTLQVNDLIELSNEAQKQGLLTMLYTGYDFKEDQIQKLASNFDYMKCGKYMSTLSCKNNVQYGVKLATSNQNIYKKGVDY